MQLVMDYSLSMCNLRKLVYQHCFFLVDCCTWSMLVYVHKFIISNVYGRFDVDSYYY